MSTPQTSKPEITKIDELHIDIFVRHCDLNVAGKVGLHAVAEYARTIPLTGVILNQYLYQLLSRKEWKR